MVGPVGFELEMVHIHFLKVHFGLIVPVIRGIS